METNNLQEIFDVVVVYLPVNWKKFALYFAVSGNMIDPKFYVDTGKGYINCFNLGYDKQTLMNIFFTIENILISERDNLDENHKWSVFTMFVTSEGKVDANYDYTDISNTYIEHQHKWEKKFIKNVS